MHWYKLTVRRRCGVILWNEMELIMEEASVWISDWSYRVFPVSAIRALQSF